MEVKEGVNKTPLLVTTRDRSTRDQSPRYLPTLPTDSAQTQDKILRRQGRLG